jgi:hypothetical protein
VVEFFCDIAGIPNLGTPIAYAGLDREFPLATIGGIGETR